MSSLHREWVAEEGSLERGLTREDEPDGWGVLHFSHLPLRLAVADGAAAAQLEDVCRQLVGQPVAGNVAAE